MSTTDDQRPETSEGMYNADQRSGHSSPPSTVLPTERCANCSHLRSVHRSDGLCDLCAPAGNPSGSESTCQQYVPYFVRAEPFPNPAAVHQPAPVVHPGGCIQDLVLADIAARRDVGIERYGTPLQAHNGRDAMMDAYQESLDLCVYLRQVIFERDGK